MKQFLVHYGLETILLSLFIILLFLGLIFTRTLYKHICLNVAALFFALGSYELYQTAAVKGTYLVKDEEYVTRNLSLGYGPKGPERYQVNVIKRFKGSGDTIYNVNYGFDGGIRDTPGSKLEGQEFTLFLGGSFTFGEGVNDHETLPSAYAQLSEDVMVRNYGFHGYGPHQSLMTLEEDILQDSSLFTYEEGHVYYLFIPDHIKRMLGRAPWDTRGPYLYLEEGILKYGGTFKDLHLKYTRGFRALRLLWFNSKIYGKFFWPQLIEKKENLDLVIAIIYEMNRIVEARNFNFTVIFEYQPERKSLIESIKKTLTSYGVEYIDLKESIPRKEQGLYLKYDPHPSPKFYHLIAKHLLGVNGLNH